MKKKILFLALVVAAMAAVSCDTKLCYCYENGYENEVYVDSDVKCTAYSTDRRGCVEAHERMNASEIATDQKRAKAQ